MAKRIFVRRAGALRGIRSIFAGTMLTALAAPAAQSATYVWTSGNYTPGTTSPSPLTAADILSIQSASNKFFLTSFSNASGLVDWLAGDLYFGGGATVDNSGLWRALGDNAIYNTSGGGTFVNSGIFRKETGTGTTGIQTTFTNSGQIDVQSGTVHFSGNGSVFNAGSSFTGTGIAAIAANVAFNGGISSANLDFVSGVYTGTGAVLSGTADFLAGTFAGDWTINTGSALNISGASNKFIAGSFTNEGTLNWSQADIYLQGGATVTNDSNWIITGNNSIFNTTGGGTIYNNGLFQKDGGTGTTGVNVAFVNTGAIDAATGTLRFSGTGQVFNNGTSFTGAGINQIAGSAAFNGAISSTNLDFAGSVYTGTGAVLSGTADFLAGTFAGDWTVAGTAALNISGASNKFIAGSFTNEGTVNWSQSDIYLQGGATVTNDSNWIITGNNSIFNTTGGGTIYNNGLFQKDGGTGTTGINVAFVNTGAIDAATGTLRFSGTGQVFNSGTSFTGAGINQIAGSAAFNGAISSTNLDFAGSVYTGTGAVLSGTADFLAGTFAGDWTVAGTAALSISGASNKFIAGSFTNEGTLNWSQSDIYLQGGATVTNEGRITATSDNYVLQTTGGGVIVNNGVIEKTGGTGVTSFAAPISNNGMIDVQSGTIALPSNFTNDGTLAGVGAYNVSGTLTNAGIIAPGVAGAGIGTLTLNGNFAQTATGLLDIQFGAGGLADLFLVNGVADLDGTLGLTCTACVFNVGDIFTLLDATGDLTGVFANVTTNGFNTGFAYSVLYDSIADRVQLRIDDVGTSVTPPGAVPEPESWLMMILGIGVAGGLMRRRASNIRVSFA